MLSENVYEFLGQLGKLAKDHFSDCFIDEQENGPVLIMTSPSPFDEEEEIAYSVQVEDGQNGFVLLQYNMIPFTEIPEEKLEELGRAVCFIDPTLSFGNFILAREGRLMIFRQCEIVPDDIDMQTAIQYSLRCFSLMEGTVSDRGTLLYDLINGKVTLEEIKAALAVE